MVSIFSKRLREVRENRKKTQEQMAQVVGKSTVSYGAWERGDNEPNLASLIEICSYLDVSADWLLGLKRGGVPANIDTLKSEADQAAATLQKLIDQLKGVEK